MFTRVALIVLSISCLVVESSKIHDVVKHVGKRFQELGSEAGAYGWSSACWAVSNECEWAQLSDEELEKNKKFHSERLSKVFVEATSAQNHDHEKTVDLLSAIMDSEMKAEVCGDKKPMNGIQYIKYLRKAAAQYNMFPNRQYKWEYVKIDDRKEINFKVNVNQTDTFGLPVQLYFDVTAQLDIYELLGNDKKFRIIKVIQGGTCAEHGTVGFTGNGEVDVDIFEELRTNPSVKLFFKLFTPTSYQLEDLNPNKLPRYWISGLTEADSKINVCREGSADAVVYTPDQFRVWYRHFGMMWHTKKGDTDPMQLQVITITNDSIIARVTMKLQMGRDADAKVHDWNFKFSAKVKAEEPKYWYIDHVEVLCTPTVDLKDQSLLTMRDVVADAFITNLVHLPDPSNTEAALSVFNLFTKAGLQNFQYNIQQDSSQLARVQYSFWRHMFKFPSYSKLAINRDEYTLPAPDTSSFVFSTVSRVGAEQYEYESDWTFDIKWDEMDQVYLIEKLFISKMKQIPLGEYGDKKYVEIVFPKKESR